MFGQLNGLPVHVLVVHAAVVFAPLAALAGIAGLVPRWRRSLDGLTVGLSAVAALAVLVAMKSGDTLKQALGAQVESGPTGDLVDRHEELGNLLWIALLVLLGLAVAALVVGRRSSAPPVPEAVDAAAPATGGADSSVAVKTSPRVQAVSTVRMRGQALWLGNGVAALRAAASVAVVLLAFLTGEAGAEARWNPDGSFDYSGD